MSTYLHNKPRRSCKRAMGALAVFFTLALQHGALASGANIPAERATQAIGGEIPFVVPEVNPLALDDAIRDLLDREVRSLTTKKQRLQRLHDVFYQPYYYNIRYEPDSTLTATETFYRGHGNCVSLANLFVGAARYVGLDARFQKVKIEREWHPREGYYEVPGHINVIVNLPTERAEIEFNRAYFDDIRQDRVTRRLISDRQAKAEYLNNLGVEAMDNRKVDHAIAYFEAAAKTHRRLSFVYSNMGVAFKKSGDYKNAEQAYLKALKLNRRNLSTISNIYILYQELGETQKSEKYAEKAERYARKNPYYLEKLAVRELAKSNYQEARDLLRKAVRIYDMEPSFFHQLAVAYFGLENHEKAHEALETAKHLSRSDQQRARYQRKLDALAALHP